MSIDSETPGVTPDIFEPVKGIPEPGVDLDDPAVSDPLPSDATEPAENKERVGP